MMPKARGWDLSVEEFRAILLSDRAFREEAFRMGDISVRELAERLANEVCFRLRLPSIVLADGKAVASYPSSLWQHIRKALGLRYKVTEIKLREVVSFPDIPLPDPHCRRMRVYTETYPADTLSSGYWTRLRDPYPR